MEQSNIPLIYVLLNGELNMSAGKAAAQTAHAIAELHHHGDINNFAESRQRMVIVLEAKNQTQIDNLETYLDDSYIPCASYIDEGVNEVSPYSTTALAVGPIYSRDREKRELFESFSLYPATKKKWFRKK